MTSAFTRPPPLRMTSASPSCSPSRRSGKILRGPQARSRWPRLSSRPPAPPRPPLSPGRCQRRLPPPRRACCPCKSAPPACGSRPAGAPCAGQTRHRPGWPPAAGPAGQAACWGGEAGGWSACHRRQAGGQSERRMGAAAVQEAGQTFLTWESTLSSKTRWRLQTRAHNKNACPSRARPAAAVAVAAAAQQAQCLVCCRHPSLAAAGFFRSGPV